MHKQQLKKLHCLVLGNDVGEEVLIDNDNTVKSFYPMLSGGKTVGYIFRLNSKGYGGDMALLAAVSTKGEILSAVLMENQETPGLGKEAEKPSYMNKFIGKGADSPVPVKKNELSPEDAATVTGSTVTFTGIGKALLAAHEYSARLLSRYAD